MTALLLAFTQKASFRKESVILARYPAGAKALANLKRDTLVEYANDACDAVRVTAAGRAELRRLREAERAGRAA